MDTTAVTRVDQHLVKPNYSYPIKWKLSYQIY